MTGAVGAARLAVSWCLVSCLLHSSGGHGRLYEPPGRSSAWRYGFSVPRNDDDHALNCGGFSRQWVQNSGRCGICGDAWDLAQPRPNEAGGMYGRGEIVRTYAANASIPVGIELTANHRGFFEMRICPLNSNARPATQRCLDRYKLQLADGGGVRYYPQPAWNGKIQLRYKLPAALTCRQCVLQWRYVAGNNWGTCANGTEGIGCGPQEEFRACADVSVIDENGVFDETRYDWAESELGGSVPEGEAALIAETVAAVVLGVLGVVVFFGAVCCWIFLISNPTLTRGGKLAKPSETRPTTDTSAIYEVSSSDGSTGSRTAPQFAGDEASPEPPVAPRRKRAGRLAPVEEPEEATTQGGDEAWSSRSTPVLEISRPTQVTVNGVAVVPDPIPEA
ncbi:uncharacterized protein LOC119112980 [Pollicipes pollicipes]|uniref:uncharacterized protein LOC119112980 n=1 Tax=Pollicipes pollicipes TaxID=41117 RepID=UPI00188541B7|nr:uncharacterized protein LOC119112980 [Pollicipes pollicipes]